MTQTPERHPSPQPVASSPAQAQTPRTEAERAAQAVSILAALRADPDAMVLPGTKVPVMLTDPVRLGPYEEPPEWGFWQRWMWRLFRPRQCRD
jgi:hypothetical protein